MQTTCLPPYFWCSFTRFGNSFMHGWQLVDQASRTTTLPLCKATSFSVSSQSTILSDTFDLAPSFAGFSSAAVAQTLANPTRHKPAETKTTFAGFMESKLRIGLDGIGLSQKTRRR